MSFFFDAIISKKLWEWFLGASGPHLRTTYLLRMFWLWVWLETKSCLMDVSRRMSTRDQRPPSAFRRSRKECVLLARMFCVRYFDS